MKNSVLDRLKSYFDEYFSDAAKPTAKNLFLIVVSVLTLDSFRSVRFAPFLLHQESRKYPVGLQQVRGRCHTWIWRRK